MMIEPVQNLEERELGKWIHMKGAPQNCRLNEEENFKAFYFFFRMRLPSTPGDLRRKEN